MKTNKELNTAYDTKQNERVRPKTPEYIWEPIEQVIRQWVTKNEQTWTIWTSVCSIWSRG
jgi:hypothetical protein